MKYKYSEEKIIRNKIAYLLLKYVSKMKVKTSKKIDTLANNLFLIIYAGVNSPQLKFTPVYIMTNSLKNDFEKFENLYFNVNSFKNNNFFSLLNEANVEELLIKLLKKNPFKNENLDKLFKKNIKEIVKLLDVNNLNFSEFTYFKDEYDIVYGYLFLFTVKTFSEKFQKKKPEKEFTELSIRDLSFDRNDFINLFLDLIFKFFLFNEIKKNIKFTFTKEYLRKFSFRFIELCVKDQLIFVKELKTRNRSYKLVNFAPFSLPYKPHVVLYTNKFLTYLRSNVEFYSYNLHFSSIIPITKQARYSNAHFKIPHDQVDVLHERNISIDRILLLKNFTFLLEEQNLNEKDDLNEIMRIYSEKIRIFNNESDVNGMRFYHSKLSKLLTLIRVQTILSLDFDNVKLFLPFMFCFRGRIYELSDFSFTFYKEFRFCTYDGVYENENEKFHPINAQINNTIDRQFQLLKKFNWFEKLSLTRKRAYIWILTSIGAMKKSELGEEVHISTFIKKGIELLEKKENINDFSDVYEKIELNYFIFLLEELKFEKNLKKWIFWKDAPASCFQHLLLILGGRDQNSYKICNLDSEDTWYDPYVYLISDYFTKKCDKITTDLYTKSGLMLTKAKYFHIFSRKRLKKIFMTESYGAGFKKLTSFFMLDLDLDLQNYSKEEKDAILEIWDSFFDYLSNENVLFAQSSKNIIQHFVTNKITKITNPDKTEVDYSCFKIEITQIEIYVEKKRHTLQKKDITSKFNESQFNLSLRANFVHTQDAVLARKFIRLTGMWSIHDCFSMDFLNISFMVALINELMNGEFYNININFKEKKIIYSIFIIL